jgi:hypothetical protein
MYLGGLIQRERLFELTARWFVGELEPADATFLTQLFCYERLLVEPPVLRLAEQLVGAPSSACWRPVQSKDQLRRALCADPRADDQESVAAACARYRAQPGSFFGGTPADLLLLEGQDHRLRALFKVKRLRRLSQRAARLVAETLGARVRGAARELAHERAELAGMPLDGFFTPPEAMAAEFAHAEALVAQRIASGELSFSRDDLAIDDVFGLALLTDDEAQLATLEERLREHADLSVESATPSDASEGAHFRAEITLPAHDELLRPSRDFDWSQAAGRGLTAAQLEAGLASHAEAGASTVRVEISLSSYRALAELELGDSPPEARIVGERFGGSYRGHIAENVAYLIEYLLMTAISPRRELEALPTEVTGRYVPETIALWISRLFDDTPPAAKSFLRP